jgi:hypothetical protein
VILPAFLHGSLGQMCKLRLRPDIFVVIAVATEVSGLKHAFSHVLCKFVGCLLYFAERNVKR